MPYRQFLTVANRIASIRAIHIQSEFIASLLSGLSAWAAVDYEGALDRFDNHLTLYPKDVVVIFIKHMLYFSIGRTSEMHKEFEQYDAHIQEIHPLLSFYLGIRSFVHNENRNFEAAYEYGIRACTLQEYNIYARHAVAHALHEQGRWEELVSFLRDSRNYWQSNPGMRMHVAWHLAMGYFMNGEIEKSEVEFDNVLSMKSAPWANEDLDTIGFLWRYKLRFPDERKYDYIWHSQCAHSLGCVCGSSNYFHSFMAAIVFAVNGQPDYITKMINENDGAGHDRVTHQAGVDVLKAFRAYATGDMALCEDLLTKSEPFWDRLGGSFAQREVLSITKASLYSAL